MSEATEQERVVRWAKMMEGKVPALRLLHHCPNGGSRNKAEAARLKRQGVRSGVPDLELPVPRGGYAGLYIEMKHGRNRPTGNQKRWIADLQTAGNACAVCYSADEAIDVIERYMQGEPIPAVATGR